MAPKTCPAPNPGTTECVTLHGKQDFADVIKIRILRWGDRSVLSGLPQCNQKGLYKGMREAGESEKET